MKNIIILAFKNLTRHKKRTILTSAAIAFGIMLLIWMHGLLKWADNESKRNLKGYEFGNFIVSWSWSYRWIPAYSNCKADPRQGEPAAAVSGYHPHKLRYLGIFSPLTYPAEYDDGNCDSKQKFAYLP